VFHAITLKKLSNHLNTMKEDCCQEKSIGLSSKDAQSCQKGSELKSAQRKCIWASLHSPTSAFDHFISSLALCQKL